MDSSPSGAPGQKILLIGRVDAVRQSGSCGGGACRRMDESDREAQMSDVLDDLVEMSKALGDPANDYAIIGEGNTSTRADEDDCFWVKASGTQLAQACRESF